MAHESDTEGKKEGKSTAREKVTRRIKITTFYRKSPVINTRNETVNQITRSTDL